MPVFPPGVRKKNYRYRSDANQVHKIVLNSDLAAVAGFEEMPDAELANNEDVRDAGIRVRGAYLKKVGPGPDKRNFVPCPTPDHAFMVAGGTVNFEGRANMVITGTRAERKRF